MSKTSDKPIYEAIGYTFFENAPKVITGLILSDTENNYQFRASLLEALELKSQGRIKFPDTDEDDSK